MALVQILLKKYEEAEQSCNQIILSEFNNPVALFRRAAARIKLNKFKEARRDLRAAKKLLNSEDQILLALIVQEQTKLQILENQQSYWTLCISEQVS